MKFAKSLLLVRQPLVLVSLLLAPTFLTFGGNQPDTTPPTVPANLAVTAPSCSQDSLSWSASTDPNVGGHVTSGLKGYNVYIGGTFLEFVSAPSTTAVDAGLSANTLYSYQVSAVDNAGNESAKSGAVSLTTPLCPDTTPPNTPAGLSANSQSCTNVSLSWNASTDPTVSGQITSGLKWYNLYRSGTWLKFVTGTSTTDSGVTGSTSYSYQVSAVDNANNESALSGAVGVTTPGCSSSATPARNLKLTRSGETAILQWSGTTGCLYQAECSLSLSGPWVPVDAPTTSFSVMSVAPLQPSAVYRVALFTNTAKYLANVTVNQNDKNLPTVPSGLTAVSNLFSEVNLSWLGSIDSGTTVGGTTYTSGLSGYLIYRNNIFLKKVDAPTTSTLDTGVNLATPCQYTVAAIDNAGNVSAKSVAASPFTTPVPPPSVPTSLGGGATTCTSIILSWNASTDTGGPGLAGYNVFRNGSFLIQVPGNGWTDNGLAASSTYSYAVSAVDTTGLESSQSAALSITTPACPDTTPPSVPSGLTGSAPSCTSASLSWNASTDPTVSGQTTSGLKGYYLYRNGVFVQQVLAPTTSATDNGLSGSTSYTYTVSAVDNAGNQSAQSGSFTVTTPACPDTTPPSVPGGLTGSAPTCATASLSWSASTDTGGSGLKGYYLFRNGGFVQQVLAPATTATDSGLSGSTSYSYTVLALDNAGNQSAQSGAFNVTTPACPDTTPPTVPGGLTGSAPNCTNVSLSWNASTDPTVSGQTTSGLKGYNLYRGGTFLKLVTGTSTTDSGLAGSISYSYTVSALDNAGNQSAQSGSFSLTTPACPVPPPTVPTGLASSGLGCTNITLTWNASTDVGGPGLAGYKVYRNGSFVIQESGIGLTDNTLAPSSSYSYTVSAVDTTGLESAQCSPVSVTTPSCACAYSLSSNSAAYGPAGGSGSFSVATGSGCPWTATPSNTWLHTTSAGSGPGTVSYTVDTNPSASSRSGTIGVDHQTFTITQSGHSAPTANPGPTLAIRVGVTNTFNGSGSSAYDGATITSYSWTFGDGGTAAGVSVAHAYSSAGTKTVTLTVTDSFGASGSGTATVTATNAVVAAPLSVTLTSPANGATVSNTITLAATASTNTSKVEFYCDSVSTPLGTATSVPYTASCDTTTMANGSHSFYCKAYDAAGNSTNSANLAVTVNNVTTTPGQLQWVKTMLSGGGNAPANGVVTDHSGNVYVVGYFAGTVNFGTGSISSIPTGVTGNIFLAKYNSQGALQWVKILSGTGNDIGRAVAVDSQNNVIIVGNFQGTLDFGGGALTSLANENMFVAKYSTAGTYQWAKRLGGTYSDAAYAVAVDGSDNVILTGRFTSVAADYGNGWTISASGSQSIALVKLSGSNGSTAWAKSYGGSGYNQPQGLAVDRNGDAVITGFFFPATDLGGGNLNSAGASDILLGKYSGVDGSYKWGKRLGSSSGDSGVGVATDPATGNVMVTGGYNGVVDFGGGGLDTFNNGGIYLAGYDPSGNYLWAIATGGSGDTGAGVSIDSSGNLGLTGKASYAIYFGGSQSLLGNGQVNLFVAAFTLSGNAAPTYRWAKTVGPTSTGASVGNGVTWDSLGHILVGGSFTSTIDFGGISATAGAPGYSSGFLTQYSR